MPLYKILRRKTGKVHKRDRSIVVTDEYATPQEPQKHNAEVRSLKIDERLKEDTLKRFRSLVEGNQYNPDDVVLKAFEGEVLQFQAETTMQIATKISKKTVVGRVKGPVQVANQIEADNAIRKEYLKLCDDRDMTRTIREVALKRDDKGFAQQGIVIPLPFWKREFVFFEPCRNCSAKGVIRCQRCAGKGMEPCTECRGSGMAMCIQCRGGQQIVGPQGNKIPCPTCHGRGKMSCRTCQQSGRIQCKVCRTKGETTCTACQGHAWNSQLQIVEIEARCSFDYPRDQLPDKVAAMVDSRGPKIKDDAEIHVSQLDADYQDEVKQMVGHDIVYRVPVQYEVILPYAHVEVELSGKSYYAFLFGIRGRLTHVSPFLEDLIKNGRRKLEDAAEGRGDVAENLQVAASYRTIKDAIIGAAKMPLGKAAKLVKQKNSIGIDDQNIKSLVITADKALKRITNKPRQIGMALGNIAAAGFFALYFLGPLRQTLVGSIANSALHPAIDGLILVLSSYLAIVGMQMAASNALRKAMTGIIPAGQERGMTPKLGSQGILSVALVVISFFVLMEVARQTGAAVPAWYSQILAPLGL